MAPASSASGSGEARRGHRRTSMMTSRSRPSPQKGRMGPARGARTSRRPPRRDEVAAAYRRLAKVAPRPRRRRRAADGRDQRRVRPAARHLVDRRAARAAAAGCAPAPAGAWLPPAIRSALGHELLGVLEPDEDVWLVTPTTTWASPQALLAASDRPPAVAARRRGQRARQDAPLLGHRGRRASLSRPRKPRGDAARPPATAAASRSASSGRPRPPSSRAGSRAPGRSRAGRGDRQGGDRAGRATHSRPRGGERDRDREQREPAIAHQPRRKSDPGAGPRIATSRRRRAPRRAGRVVALIPLRSRAAPARGRARRPRRSSRSQADADAHQSMPGSHSARNAGSGPTWVASHTAPPR